VERYSDEQERIAQALEASDHYRVLRRLVPRPVINPPDGTPTRIGLFVDVETTGLESSTDEVIELAMVPFTFGMDGRIFEIGRPLEQKAEPSQPIPLNVQQLTGLTAGELSGKVIDLFEVDRYTKAADLIVAHHARFDRPFLENLSPAFQQRPWACSMSQINWCELGYESTKLEYLALKTGYFFTGHRAVWDCFAGIELLASRVGDSNGMCRLLKNALKTSWRIGVTGSPFAANAALRDRGYKWVQRRWEVEVDEASKAAELLFLKSERFGNASVIVDRVSPFERFSDRRTLHGPKGAHSVSAG